MNSAILALVGIWELGVVLLVLLAMAGVVAGVVLLAIWLWRRPQPPASSPRPAATVLVSPEPAPAVCPRCHSPLPPSSPQGLCPRCVMEAGLATQTEIPGEAAPAEGAARRPALAPEAIAGHFPHLEILECLGRGGMGVVYKARQPKLNRLVALKILAPERGADPRFAERFQREAMALAKLDHPSIVTVHDFGEVEGLFYLLMEYVDGANLRQTLRAGRLKPEHALAIVPPICEALQFAHERGVVHRDIKPENVLLDKQGRVKIADFGIAKLVGTDRPPAALTEERAIVGTPHYMAPEQVEHPGLVDHRADIYSLGVVFYEMLTGELPLGKFQPPSRKVEVDVRLDEVVLHALEKEPARRYQHASEVKTDVESITSNPPAGGGRTRAREREADRQDRVPTGLTPYNPWEMTLTFLGTVFFIGMLLVVPALPQPFPLPLLFMCLVGLGICALTWAGLWPFPSPFFPIPNFSSRNLRRGMVSRAVAVAGQPWIAFGVAMTCAGTLGAGLLGTWRLIGVLVLLAVASASLALILDRFTPATTQRAVFRFAAVVALVTALPVIGLAVFFLFALTQERGGWNPAADEAVLVPLTWLGALVLPMCGWRLWQASRTPPANHGQTTTGAWTIAVIMGFLLLAVPVGSLLVRQIRPQPMDAQTVVRVEEKLRSEIQRRLAEGGWRAESLSVNVTPDLKRAECRFGRIWKNGLTQVPPSPAAFDLEPQGNNLWRVRGEGAFAALRFSVDTSTETAEGRMSDEATSRAAQDLRVAEPEPPGDPARVAAAFTSIHLVTLNDMDDASGREVLDLDTGRTLDLPADIEERAGPERLRWLAEQGADLLLDRVSGRWGLLTTTDHELRLAPLTDEQWEDIGETGLTQALAAGPAGLEIIDRGPWRVYVLEAGARPPLTFAFETAVGTRGLLQITRLTEDPNSAQIRFKRHGSGLAEAGGQSGTPAAEAARVLIVTPDGTGTHRTIQAALDAAAEGAVIRVGPGRYETPLHITRPVRLIGAGCNETVIGPTRPWTAPSSRQLEEVERQLRAAETGTERDRLRREARERFFRPVVRVAGTTGVQFEGIRFTQPGVAPEGKLLDLAVLEISEAGVEFADCAVVGSPGNGILLGEGAAVTIRHSLIAAAWNTGVRVERGTRARLMVSESDVRNCFYGGIVIGRGQNAVTIERCRISGAAWHGVRYDDASPTVAGNLIFANARSGIYASGRTAARLRENVFWKNEMTGVSCWFENHDRIEQNTFAANQREGLSVLGASLPAIERNVFWRHPVAIRQGHIDDSSPAAKLVEPLRLEANLFWTNEVHVVSHLGQAPGDTNAPPPTPLTGFPGNLEVDPGFRDASGGDFGWLPEAVAPGTGRGAPTALLPTSPWPLQPEELAIVPTGETRDSREWRRPGGV